MCSAEYVLRALSLVVTTSLYSINVEPNNVWSQQIQYIPDVSRLYVLQFIYSVPVGAFNTSEKIRDQPEQVFEIILTPTHRTLKCLTTMAVCI